MSPVATLLVLIRFNFGDTWGFFKALRGFDNCQNTVQYYDKTLLYQLNTDFNLEIPVKLFFIDPKEVWETYDMLDIAEYKINYKIPPPFRNALCSTLLQMFPPSIANNQILVQNMMGMTLYPKYLLIAVHNHEKKYTHENKDLTWYIHQYRMVWKYAGGSIFLLNATTTLDTTIINGITFSGSCADRRTSFGTPLLVDPNQIKSNSEHFHYHRHDMDYTAFIVDKGGATCQFGLDSYTFQDEPKILSLFKGKSIMQILRLKEKFTLDDLILYELTRDVKVISVWNWFVFPIFVDELDSMSENENFNFILTGQYSANFLICDGLVEDEISFRVYVKPFQKEVWIILFVFCLISVIIITLIFNIQETISTKKKSFSQLALLGLQILTGLMCSLLEASFSYPISLLQRSYFKFYLIAWLFMGLILSTAYKGSVISNLMTPKLSQSNYTETEQLQEFALFSPKNIDMKIDNYYHHLRDHRFLSEPDCYVHKNKVRKHRMRPGYPFLSGGCGFKFEKDAKLASVIIKTTVVPDKFTTAEFLAQIHQLLSNCSKVAFVESSNILKYVHAQMKLMRKKNIKINGKEIPEYFMGQRGILELPGHYGMSRYTGSYMPNRMTNLMSSGIYRFWEKFLVYDRASVGHEIPQPSKISLNQSFVTIFYILLFFEALACICFLAEWLRASRLR